MVTMAFHIERGVFYRFFTPIIEAALLKKELNVECWHDYGHPTTGNKAYQFPRIEHAPEFKNGQPGIKTFNSSHEMAELCRNTSRNLAIISLNCLARYPEIKAIPQVKWIHVQHHVDTFTPFSLDELLSNHLLAFITEFWFDYGRAHFSKNSGFSETKWEELRKKSVFIGNPELDGYSYIDKIEVKKRIGIDENKKIVTYLAWARVPIHKHWWNAFGFPVYPKHLLKAFLKDPSLFFMLCRGWSEFHVFEALHEYCKRENAVLITKSRQKSRDPSYLAKKSDFYFLEETWSPPLILQLMAISDICVHYFSMGVLEAAGAGAKSVCILPNPYTFKNGDRYVNESTLFDREEGGLFQWKGVSEVFTPISLVKTLKNMPIEKLLKVDQARHSEYCERHLGPQDRKSSERLLDSIFALLDSQAI